MPVRPPRANGSWQTQERTLERIPFQPYVNCPQCSARNPATGDRCKTCGQPLTLYIGPAENWPRRLDLGALMVVIALVAFCLGITREVPVLGVLLLAVTVPALLRTFVWIARQKGDGLTMLWPEKLGAFGASAGIVWLILTGTGAAFAFSLTVGIVAGAAVQAVLFGFSSGGSVVPYFGVPIACVGGGFAGYYLVKVLWPIRD